jgi:hypothetical protein
MKFSCISEGSAKYVSKKLDTAHAQLSVSAPMFLTSSQHNRQRGTSADGDR